MRYWSFQLNTATAVTPTAFAGTVLASWSVPITKVLTIKRCQVVPSIQYTSTTHGTITVAADCLATIQYGPGGNILVVPPRDLAAVTGTLSTSGIGIYFDAKTPFEGEVEINAAPSLFFAAVIYNNPNWVTAFAPADITLVSGFIAVTIGWDNN